MPPGGSRGSKFSDVAELLPFVVPVPDGDAVIDAAAESVFELEPLAVALDFEFEVAVALVLEDAVLPVDADDDVEESIHIDVSPDSHANPIESLTAILSPQQAANFM
jgi:hypothetical protein